MSFYPLLSNDSGGHRGRGGGIRGGRGGRGGANDRGRGGAPIDRTGVPKGLCSFYWHAGVCFRSFECTFKHQAKPEAFGTSSVSATEAEDQAPDFFSREGLALNNGSVQDAQHALRPNEAHNHLKSYLADYFIFRDAHNVEGFSRIFASVNSRNKAWVRTTSIMLYDLIAHVTKNSNQAQVSCFA